MPQIIAGVSGVNRKASKISLGVSGVNRECKEAWAGVNGVKRMVYNNFSYQVATTVMDSLPTNYPSTAIIDAGGNFTGIFGNGDYNKAKIFKLEIEFGDVGRVDKGTELAVVKATFNNFYTDYVFYNIQAVSDSGNVAQAYKVKGSSELRDNPNQIIRFIAGQSYFPKMLRIVAQSERSINASLSIANYDISILGHTIDLSV